MEKIKTPDQPLVPKDVIDFDVELVKKSSFRNGRRRGKEKTDINKEKLRRLPFFRNGKVEFEFLGNEEGHSTVVHKIGTKRNRNRIVQDKPGADDPVDFLQCSENLFRGQGPWGLVSQLRAEKLTFFFNNSESTRLTSGMAATFPFDRTSKAVFRSGFAT